MEKQILLWLLILCITLSQGFAYLSNNGSLDSLDHLVRRKRVVDTTPNADNRVRRIQDVHYIVRVQRDGDHACAGSILLAHVVLTLASCVQDEARRYSIRSGTLFRTTGGSSVDVHEKLIHPGYEHFHISSNIALLSLAQVIILRPNLNQPISIYNSNNGVLPVHSLVTVSGWGLSTNQSSRSCINPLGGRGGVGSVGLILPNTLRSITLNTISIEDCRVGHNNNAAITNNLICTFHEQKYCAPGDEGDPLVFAGHLAGMLAMRGIFRSPDVYVNVGLPVNRDWIIRQMHNIPTPGRPHNHRQLKDCSRVHPC